MKNPNRKSRWVLSTLNKNILAFSLIASSVTYAEENILLIIADDYGAESSGLYNNPNAAPTPHIDSLSSNGIRFTEAWSQASCTPTRATILTGRYGFRTGVGAPRAVISLDEFTMAQGLKTAGYNTACIGKWHLSNRTNGGDDNPNIMGFDHYEGGIEGDLEDYFNWTKVTNGATSTETNYATTEAVDNALSWIEGQGDNKWFCQLAFNAPHDPYHLPPNNLHSSDNLSGTTNDINNNNLAYYHAMIEAMDTEIGRLLNSLDDEVLANTNIIFIGDNGTPRNVNPDIVRGAKGSLYEGGVHIPFIVAGPSVNSPGRTVDVPIHTVDIFETVLDMAGIQSADIAPAGITIDSVSIRDYLTTPDQESFHGFNFADSFTTPATANDGVAITDGTFKLIRFDSNGNEELYQTPSDTTESNNLNDGDLSASQQEAFNTLEAQLDELINNQNIDRGENQPDDAVMTVITDDWTQLNGWKNIPLSGFTDPIVIASPVSYAGTNECHVRIRNVSSNRFEYMVEEWDYLDGDHGTDETISFLVMERGVHELGGIFWDAGSAQVNDEWTTVTFQRTHDGNQGLLSQCVTVNDESAVVTRHRNISGDNFEILLQEERNNNPTHTTETVHYIAHELGVNPRSSSIDGLDFQAGHLDGVTDANTSIAFVNTTDAPPALFAQIRTFNDSDPSGLRITNIGIDDASIFVEEEASDGSNNAHSGGDVVDWLLFDIE